MTEQYVNSKICLMNSKFYSLKRMKIKRKKKKKKNMTRDSAFPLNPNPHKVTSVLVQLRQKKKDVPLWRLPFAWIGIEFYNFIKVVNATIPIPP